MRKKRKKRRTRMTRKRKRTVLRLLRPASVNLRVGVTVAGQNTLCSRVANLSRTVGRRFMKED